MEDDYEYYEWDDEIYDDLSDDMMCPVYIPLPPLSSGDNMDGGTLEASSETTLINIENGQSKKKKRLSMKSLRTLLVSPKQRTKLAKSVMIRQEGNRSIRIETTDKLIIMLNFKNKHCIYRQKDGTIAVLEDATFQQSNPPTLLDGDKYENELHNARVVLMYAISKQDKSAGNRGVALRKNELFLVLAQSRTNVVGITIDKKVGIYKSSHIKIITEPRECISGGMILNMIAAESFVSRQPSFKSVDLDELYQVAKGPIGLLTWIEVTDERLNMPLHALIETTLLQDSGSMHTRPIRSMKHADDNYQRITGIFYGDMQLSQKLKEPLPQPDVEEEKDLHTDVSLESEVWFFGNLSRKEAEERLMNNGDFLVRHKSDRPWEYVISFKHDGAVNHMELLLKDGYYKTRGGKFKSVRVLIHMHWKQHLPLSTDDQSILLINPINRKDCVLDDTKLFAEMHQKDDSEMDLRDIYEEIDESTPSVKDHVEAFGGSGSKLKQVDSETDFGDTCEGLYDEPAPAMRDHVETFGGSCSKFKQKPDEFQALSTEMAITRRLLPENHEKKTFQDENSQGKDSVKVLAQKFDNIELGLSFSNQDLYDETEIYTRKNGDGSAAIAIIGDTSLDRGEHEEEEEHPVSLSQSSRPATFAGQEVSLLKKEHIVENLTYIECYIDEEGGEICIPSASVKVSIPPNALTSGEIISITVFEDNPFITNDVPRVCPVLRLNPDGVEFKEPVEVSIPHCGILEDGETTKTTINVGRFINDTDKFQWTEMDSKCTLSNNLCCFHLNHFCFVDVKIGVKGKTIKVVPVAERMHLGEDLLMTCWILNSKPTQDIHDELRNDISPSSVILDTFQEFVVHQSERLLYCTVTSRNEEWNPISTEKAIPFSRIWHSSRACFKFNHDTVSEIADEETPLNFTFLLKQPENDEIEFNIRAKLKDLIRSPESPRTDDTQRIEEDVLLCALARRLDRRDCMRVATYFDLSPEAVDYIRGSSQLGIALFTELRKRNFYNDSNLHSLTNALRDIKLTEFASQIATIFPKRVKASNINVEVPDPFGKLKVTISDALNRNHCRCFALLWNLTVSFEESLENDDTPGITLLSELYRQGLFGKNILEEFSQTLKELNFNDLVNSIHTFRKKHRGTVTKKSLNLKRFFRFPR